MVCGIGGLLSDASGLPHGRNPLRQGIPTANKGFLRPQEITIAEVLKSRGYATGHFGKWHLGVFTLKVRDSNRGGPKSKAEHLSTPLDNGFDVCFSTEAKVPTWNPMGTKKFYGTRYWTGPEKMVPPDSDLLKGDDSRVIMDQALPFIQKAVAEKKPFLAVIWFHTPHLPVVAGPKYLEMYKDAKTNPHYLGCITAMDEQVGRLRKELRDLGTADNTMLWFSSDNGPEGSDKAPGKTPYRGRKRSLYEGGVRVPGLLEWPARIPKSRVVTLPCTVSDYFPTISEVVGYRIPEKDQRPYDGISLVGLIDGKMEERPAPIGFTFGGQNTMTDNRYKLYRGKRRKKNDRSGAGPDQLYDLLENVKETRDLAADHPEVMSRLREKLDAWLESCARSEAGEDYNRN